jgi:hypothetical protein
VNSTVVSSRGVSGTDLIRHCPPALFTSENVTDVVSVAPAVGGTV